VNKPGQYETALVTATPADVVVSAVFFALLTGIVISFFVTARKMFRIGLRR